MDFFGCGKDTTIVVHDVTIDIEEGEQIINLFTKIDVVSV
jgi:hypothetical protein